MIARLCLSPYVETFNSKLIKRFRTWTRSRYVFSNFEIPMFFICSIVMEHFCRVTPEKKNPRIVLFCFIFPSPLSARWSLIWVVNLFIFCVPERRTATIRKMPIASPMLVINGTPADHDTQICCLVPMLNYVSTYHCSWVVYCGNTRSRGCLLSVRLI